MFIADWWNSLNIAAQAFYCVAIPATLILIVQTVLMFIGIGNDADGVGDDMPDDLGDATPDDMPDAIDAEDISGLADLRIFTLRGIVSFFVVFGWVGVAMDSVGAAIFVTIPVAIVSGFAMAFTLSLDDFIITQFNKGDTGIETLSTYIYEDARVKSLEPFWFAVFSIFFVVVLTLLLIVNISKNSKKEA